MSGRSVRACVVHRDDDAFAFQEMAETEDRAPFVFDIMPSGYCDVRMPQHRACGEKAIVDMFHLKAADFCSQVDKVLTVGEFYALSAGGQIIFT
jgi:hypothetical protein